jgi:choice-of-anchor C domain-containing protein
VPLALAALVVFASGAHAADTPRVLLPDGSFEQPEAPANSFVLLPEGTAFSGWQVIGSIDIVSEGYWPAHFGEQSIDLNGQSTGGLWRNVATKPGHPYELRFFLAGNPNPACGPQGVKVLRVSAGAQTRIFSFDTTGHTLDDPDWVARHFHFRATDSLTRLVFESESPSCAGPAIDFVRLARPVDWAR